MRTVALLALILLAAGPVHAELLLTYTGLNFGLLDTDRVTGAYTTADRVTGSFLFDQTFRPFPNDPSAPTGWATGPNPITGGVLSYSFTDGHQTLTNTNSTGVFAMTDPRQPFAPSTYNPGGIWWDINLTTSAGDLIRTVFSYSGASVIDMASGPAGSGTCGVSNSWWQDCAVVTTKPDGSFTVQRGTWTVVEVPELAIIPGFLKFGPRLGLESAIAHRLQLATAWTAAHLLGVPREGVTLVLRRVRVEVAAACSGIQTVVLMLLAAGLIAATFPSTMFVGSRKWWVPALFVTAVALALEANAIRVAGIAIGLEQTAGAMAREWKDWIQIGTTGLALGQLAGIERLIGHPEAHGRVAGHVRAQSLDE